MRMPLTCWAWFTTAVLALLSFPVLLGGGILLLLDRLAGTSFFIPGGLYVSGVLSGTNPNFPLHTGGSPILWQHLLVLRSPGSLHRNPPGHGCDFSYTGNVCSQTSIRLSRNGVFHLRNRAVGFLCVGPSHVHQWHELLTRR